MRNIDPLPMSVLLFSDWSRRRSPERMTEKSLQWALLLQIYYTLYLTKPLAHPSGIHAQHLVLDPAHILRSFWDELRLKAAVPIPRCSDAYFPDTGFYGLVRISISPIGCVLIAPPIKT